MGNKVLKDREKNLSVPTIKKFSGFQFVDTALTKDDLQTTKFNCSSESSEKEHAEKNHIDTQVYLPTQPKIPDKKQTNQHIGSNELREVYKKNIAGNPMNKSHSHNCRIKSINETVQSGRAISCDDKPTSPEPLPLQFAPKLRNKKNLDVASSFGINSFNSSFGSATSSSFQCSIECADAENEENINEDEFAQFVKASKHPPNELSVVPRCYTPENSTHETIRSPSLTNRSRTSSVSSRQSSISYSRMSSCKSSGSSRSCSGSPRPQLRRESAQDMEDGEVSPNINIEMVDSYHHQPRRRLFLTVSDGQQSPNFQQNTRILHQRSAPGSPMLHCRGARSCSRSPSRTDSAESGKSHLRVPLVRTRGISLPNGMEESLTKNNTYLLRQFNIKGRKVIHIGDSYHSRGSSNTSINSLSYASLGSCSKSLSAKSSVGGSIDEDVSKEERNVQASRELSLDYPITQDHPFKVCIIGPTGVGKTTLKHNLMSSKLQYQGHMGDSVVVMLEEQESQIVFSEKHSEDMGDINLSEYDCLVALFSLTEKYTLMEVKSIVQKFSQSELFPDTLAIILVGNKTDLVRTRQVTCEDAREVALSLASKYVEVSAALDHNVDTLLVGIVKQIRLRQPQNLAAVTSNRRKSAGEKIKGIIEKVWGSHGDDADKSSNNFDNLNVL